ncbi:glycosyltransferase family 2 protein [Acidaminococcus provencensis]|jgi:rhamnosyltransferase|uniref:glycosyltransferase family 2 protein n=1 Tax=Acidaminococcus provencensis TaxID=2058289 RepID=UPI0022E958A6|nr:glycosyltransferase [Acidaminococcus provencensis]
MTDKKVAVIIPIYHPDSKFNALLQKLHEQKDIAFDLYIVDSGSTLNDYEADLEGLSYHIEKTNPQEFNHGGTRRKAAEQCKGYPFLIYMTQDAIPADEYALAHLIALFEKDAQIGCAYGRQLPNPDASVMAAHARLFNYPEKSQLKELKDAKKLGIKAAFLSDTFAAYRNEALQAVGNFPSHVILGEDSVVAAKMILAGWKIAYVADAQVYHSHNYTILQEFKRYFDTGAFHAEEPWIREKFGKAEGEGKRFVVSEVRYILQHNPLLLPGMVVRDGMKFLGYRLGIKEKCLSIGLKKKISMNPRYWE